jgi:hypothetical protein
MAVVSTLVLSLTGRHPLMVSVGVCIVAAASFFGWALGRRLITGRENLVQVEHVWLCLICVSGYLLWVGEPLAAWLDIVAVGLCGFLAFGRIGCFLTGCCHGIPCGFGVVYPFADHPVHGVRLYPVQLLEAAYLAGLFVIGGSLVGTLESGRVALLVGSVSAVGRFATEGLRGDHRPTVFGIPLPRVAACCQLALVVAVDAWMRHGRPAVRHWVPTLVASCVAGLLAARWRRPRPIVPSVMLGIRRAVVDAPDSPHCIVVAPGVTVAVSAAADEVHVSVAAPAHSPGTATTLLGLAVATHESFTSPMATHARVRRGP